MRFIKEKKQYIRNTLEVLKERRGKVSFKDLHQSTPSQDNGIDLRGIPLFHPGGASDNSPAIHRWKGCQKVFESRRDG